MERQNKTQSTTTCLQEWHSGESTTSHQCDLGLNPIVEAIYGLSLLLVLPLRGFLQELWFSFLRRNQHFQIPIQFKTHRDISTSS